MRTATLRQEFVESAPAKLDEGVLYVSMAYATVLHKCCCGCGSEVVTPLSPAEWRLTFDGETISLHPSVGNWGLACRSHYWIRHSRVHWAGDWSDEEIEIGRAADRLARRRHVEKEAGVAEGNAPVAIPAVTPLELGFWSRVQRLWGRLFG